MKINFPYTVLSLCTFLYCARPGPAQTCSMCSPAAPGIGNWWSGDFNGNDFAGGTNGTMTGGVTIVPGEVYNAFTFDGTGQVTFGAAGQFDKTDFTVNLWIKTGAAGARQALLEKRTACDSSSFWSLRLNSGVLAEISDGAGGGLQVQGTVDVEDGNYHHIALVRQNVSLSIYVDGNLDTTANSAAKVKISNKAHLTAGVSVCDGVDGTTSFIGQLDEIQLYKSALSATQIAAIYNAASAGNCK